MYLDAAGNVIKGSTTTGHLAVGVPGTVSGLETALAKYGTMKRAELIAPAIRFAEQGFVLDQGDADMFATATDAFKIDPATAAIFLKPAAGPTAPATGWCRRTSRRRCARSREAGAAGFYKGPVAHAIVASSRAGKGLITQADLDQYTTRELAPVECDYRGYHVVSAPPPSSGGVIICEILNILEGYPLKDWGFRSAQAVHVQIEAMRHAYVDRNSYLGDPDFVKNPLDRLLDKAYAAKIRAAIDPNKAAISKDLKPGVAAARGQQHHALLDRRRQGQRGRRSPTRSTTGSAPRSPPPAPACCSTTRWTTSPPSSACPTSTAWCRARPNAIAPGKRPLSSMSPTIVSKDGKPVMVVGTPGGSRIITAVLHTIINVIDYGMNVQEAVDAPRFHQQWLPNPTNLEPFALSPDTRRILEGMGHVFARPAARQPRRAILVGAPTLGGKPVGKNRFYGANDPRRNIGLALGY